MSEKLEIMKQYKLTPEEHDAIYETICKLVYRKKVAVEKPTAIIVGGVPGSGKGSLIGASKKEFKDKNITIITTDEYKTFHPKVKEIAKNYPTYFVEIVEQDSAKWTHHILQKAIHDKYNFIFEATLKNNRILDRIRELKTNGFKVIVKVLAVPYIEGLLSIHERYIGAVKIRKWGRLITIPHYNTAYVGLLETVEQIQNSKLCDEIEVYIRDTLKQPKLVYSTKDTKQCDITAKQVIINWREKVEVKEVEQRLKKLEENFETYVTTKQEKEQLEELKKIIKKEWIL